MELGLLNPRMFENAIQGYLEKRRDAWEQARLISWYSAFDRRPFDLDKIKIPVSEVSDPSKTSRQQNKSEAYKLLEKWSK